MSFRTITARYPGTCRRCHNGIEVGTRIRFGGRGMTYHMAAECPASEAGDGQAVSYRRGRSGRRYAADDFIPCWDGGRCEDAPCCGCGSDYGSVVGF